MTMQQAIANRPMIPFNPFGEKENKDYLASIESETFWPMARRGIHCSVTGRKYGTIDELVVRECISAYGGKEMNKLEEMITRLTMFSGPSPMWQSIMPDRLVVNKGIDPYGYWIYIVRRVYKDVEDTMASLNMPLYYEWRRDIIKARLLIEKVDVSLIHRVNELLTIMSAYGILPSPAAFPRKHLSDLANAECVREIINVCGKFYKGFRKAYRGKMPDQNRHKIHERTAMRMAGLDTAESKASEDFMHLLVTQLILHDKVTDMDEVKEYRYSTEKLLQTVKQDRSHKMSSTGIIPAGTIIKL